MQKSLAYFKTKATIDKAQQKNTAYKIQTYANRKVDELVANYNNAGVSSKPTPAMLSAELSILNKPEVYKNYNRIIQSPYTSNNAIDNMLVKNKANTNLDNIVKAEVERISKNLDYVEQVMQKYTIQTEEYKKLLNQQAEKSIANRREVLEKVAIKNGEILASEGFNIPSNVFTYRDIETTAQSLLRESQMTSKYEEITAVNDEYLADGKDAPYTHKQWIWTGEGATTRHESNHLQKVRFDEPFIVVNDNTLDIDEMMYPCDPAGSYSNAYICYCEVDYLIGEDDEYGDNLGIGTILDNAEVFTETVPETPSVTFLPNIEGLFEEVKPTAEPLDLFSLEHGAIPNEYKLPADFTGDIETVGSEYNSNGELVNIATGEAILEYNNKLMENNVEPEVIENKGSYIDVSKYDKSEFTYMESDNSYLIDYDLLTKNEVTGKWELNGLEMDNEYGAFAEVSKEKIDAHNNQFIEEKSSIGNEMSLPETETKNTLTGEKEPTGEIINTDELVTNYEGNYLVDEVDGVKLNESTGKYEFKGIEFPEYNESVYNTDFYYNPKKDIGVIPKDMIIEHNKKLGVETKTEKTPIEDIHQQIAEEFKSDNTNVEKINPIYLDDGYNTGTYVVYEKDITYNEKTGDYEYKGLKLKDYDAEIGLAIITEEEIYTHNNFVENYENNLGNGVVQNKYINKMSEHLEPIKENGEIYIVDKRNGKKYVYDEKAVYEENQDRLQEQVHYDKPQYDSVAHWGDYGHQILNGLIYGIEEYGYHKYKPYLDKALPTIDKLRKVNKDLIKGKDIAKNTAKREKLINELGEITDNIPRQTGCYASLLKIQNAMWEMVYMDEAILKSPKLAQDTFLVRFGHFGEELCEIGKTVEMEGYTSTTYESGSASHFEDKMAENPNRWAILIMADEGTTGIRMNYQFDALTSEREWLLARNQEFEVVGFDKSARTVILKVKENKNYI